MDTTKRLARATTMAKSHRSNVYDSTAIAEWLDAHHSTEARRLIPKHPACDFVARLIDDHFDEFGLYVAHHHRWVTSAKDNDAAERVANEMVRALPALGRRQFAQWFGRRQVRRLPYLFSVAPEGYCVAGLPQALTPPSRPDFPETHTLLDDAFARSRRKRAAGAAVSVRQPLHASRRERLR